MSENAILQEYLDHKTPENREKLILQYQTLVHSIINKLPHNLKKERVLSKADMMSTGNIGLIQAVDTYDATKGTSFNTYAYQKIKWAIIDEFITIAPVSRYVLTLYRQIKETKEKIFKLTGNLPSDEELANILKVPVEKIRKVTMLMVDNNMYTFGITPTEETPTAMEDIITTEEQELVVKAIKELEAVYGEKCTVILTSELSTKELGKQLGITPNQVCRLKQNYITKIKRKLNDYIKL